VDFQPRAPIPTIRRSRNICAPGWPIPAPGRSSSSGALADYPQATCILLYRGNEQRRIHDIWCPPVEEFLRGLHPDRGLIPAARPARKAGHLPKEVVVQVKALACELPATLGVPLSDPSLATPSGLMREQSFVQQSALEADDAAATSTAFSRRKLPSTRLAASGLESASQMVPPAELSFRDGALTIPLPGEVWQL